MGECDITSYDDTKDRRTRVVEISGRMTIQHADELRSMLLEAFDSAEQVRVEMNAITEIDLAGLQMICSAHRTAVVANKGLAVSGANNGAVRASAVSAGFYRHVGCRPDPTKTCVWAQPGDDRES